MSKLQSMPTLEQMFSIKTDLNSSSYVINAEDSSSVSPIQVLVSTDLPSSKQVSVNMQPDTEFTKPDRDTPIFNTVVHNDVLPCTNITTVSTESSSSVPVREVLHRWCLGCDVYVSLEVYRAKLKVYIRKYIRNKINNLVPTKESVTLSPATWAEFCQKIGSYNMLYADTSFVSHNELICFNHNNKLHLQKLIETYDSTFSMTYCYLTLDENQLRCLKNCLRNITDMLKECVFTDWLPAQMLKIKNSMIFQSSSICDKEFAFRHLVTCVYEDVICQIRKLYKCVGCIAQISDQSYHGCLNSTPLQMYKSVQDQVLLNLDIDSIVKNIILHAEGASICYDEDFLKSFKLEDYEMGILNLFKNYL